MTVALSRAVRPVAVLALLLLVATLAVVTPAAPASANVEIRGFVDERTVNDPDGDLASNFRVRGWACVPTEPDRVLRIDIYDDLGFLFTLPADDVREPAVGAACGGNSAHGFAISGEILPPIQGQLRVFAVYTDNPPVNRLLPDS